MQPTKQKDNDVDSLVFMVVRNPAYNAGSDSSDGRETQLSHSQRDRTKPTRCQHADNDKDPAPSNAALRSKPPSSSLSLPSSSSIEALRQTPVTASSSFSYAVIPSGRHRWSSTGPEISTRSPMKQPKSCTCNNTHRARNTSPRSCRLLQCTYIIWMAVLFLPSSYAQQCKLCMNGPNETPFPDKKIGPDSQAPANTCGYLQEAAPFVSAGTTICLSLRSVGTQCGCNIAPNACSLCMDGSRVQDDFKNISLPEYDLLDYLTSVPNDSPPFTCETFESYWHARTTKDDPVCIGTVSEVQTTCGCPATPGTGIDDTSSDDSDIPLLPGNGTDTTTNSTDGTTNDDGNETAPERSIAKCTVCPLGEAVPFPDKPMKVGNLPVESCGDLEIFANLPNADTQLCAGIQGMGSFCGCTVPESRNQCPGMCPSGLPPRHPDLRLNWFSSFVNTVPQAYQTVSSTLTCELMDAIAQGGSGYLFGMDESLFCLAVELKSWVCGCDGDWRQVALTWTYRMSGVLSLLVRDV